MVSIQFGFMLLTQPRPATVGAKAVAFTGFWYPLLMQEDSTQRKTGCKAAVRGEPGMATTTEAHESKG
jgi:hypothetical protein